MSGAAPATRPRAAPRAVDPEVQQQLHDPAARRAAAEELRALASSLGQSLRRGRDAEPGQVAALQRAINLYTGSAKLEVDDKFGLHTEQALRDVQAALRADARVRDASDIGGGRAAAPTLNGLADALASDAQPAPQLQDRFQRVHAQPNVTDPIGRPRGTRAVPRGLTRPEPAAPGEVRRDPPAGVRHDPPAEVRDPPAELRDPPAEVRDPPVDDSQPPAATSGDPEAIAAARQLGQLEHSPVGFDQPEATALRDRVRGLSDTDRPRTLDALAGEVHQHPEASRGRFAATLLNSLEPGDGAALYDRIAPRGNEPGRLTPEQHLDAARALGALEDNGREFAGGMPRNALDGLHAAIRERAVSPQGTDADRAAAANLRAEIIRRNADQPLDIRDQAQRDALLADLRFAQGGAGPDAPGAASPDDAIASRIPEDIRGGLESDIVRRLERTAVPTDPAEARDYRAQLRAITEHIAESRVTTGLGERLQEPATAAREPIDLPGTVVVRGTGPLPGADPVVPEPVADALPTAADLTRLRQGDDRASYDRAVTRVADEVRTNIAADRGRIGAADPALAGMSAEVLDDLDRHLAGTLATTPENAGALATVRAAAMRARSGENYDLETPEGRERLARDATFAFGPDRSRSLLTAFMERNPEDPAHSALPPEARAELQRALLARLEPVVGSAPNPAVAAALGNVAAPEGELAGRFTRLATIASGGDITDAAMTAAQRGFAAARGQTTRPMEALAAELDRLDQLGGPPGEDRRAAIDRIARTAMQGPLSRRHAITRDLLATLNPTDAARFWENIRPRRPSDPPVASVNGEHRYTDEQLAALGMTIGTSTAQPGGENRALANLPPEALRDIDARMAAQFANSTDRITMAAAATVRAATLRAQGRDPQVADLQDPSQAAALAQRLRTLGSPRADGNYDERVAAAMHADVRAQLRHAELARLAEAPAPDPAAHRQLAAYQAGLRTVLEAAGELPPELRSSFDGHLAAQPQPLDIAARESLTGLKAAALGHRLESWRARGADGAADAADLVAAITRELSPPPADSANTTGVARLANESADAAAERQRRLALLEAGGDSPSVREIRAGVDRALVERATAYSQAHLPPAVPRETRLGLPDPQHNELSDALLRADLPNASPETRFAALHLRLERMERGRPEDLAANVAFAFNLPYTGPDGRTQPTMRDLMQGAVETISSPDIAARVEAEAQRTVAAALRARNDAEARRILEATRDALPAGSPQRTLLDGPPTVRPRARPQRPVVPADPDRAPTAQPGEAVRVPPGSIEGVDFAALRAQLQRLDNTRVDTELPLEGPYHMVYRPHSHGEGTANPFRYGTARTVAMIQMVAELYHRQTGMKLRVGDLSQRGGGPIPGHSSHQRGINIDLDLAFNDGRTTAHPRRNAEEATYRSRAYDREATRVIIGLFRNLAPNADILFNDPEINMRGVRAYGAHDNHIHIQGLGG